jgi:hypothetical protein
LTTYISSIIPEHVSQIVYLNLSERHAPHAVDWFISEVLLNTLIWSSLKALTIEDVPCHILESLLNDSPLLSNVHSLSIDICFKRYHYSEYNDFADFGIIIPILNTLPELCSLYKRMNTRTYNNYTFELSKDILFFNVHQNLHTFTIVQCSSELLIELLNNGYLFKLCHLRVSLSW